MYKYVMVTDPCKAYIQQKLHNPQYFINRKCFISIWLYTKTQTNHPFLTEYNMQK